MKDSRNLPRLKPQSQSVMSTPRSIDLEITSRCNLHCSYCYFFENHAVNYSDLPTEKWLQFFKECGRCNIMRITLSGGEPFIRNDLRQILSGIVKNRMRFSLLSNGTLIQHEIAEFIVSTGRCDSVQISVDGPDATIHDRCRGQGAFDGAIRGIRILQHHHIPVDVRVTIHRHNVRSLEAIASLLLEKLGLAAFSVNAAGYFGVCRGNAEEMLLTTQERQHAMETLLRLEERYEGRISSTAGPLTEAKIWKKMEEARIRNAPPFSRGGFLTACGCPFQSLAVRADGAFIPCTMLAHIELGRIHEDALIDVWQQSPALHELRQRQKIPLTNFTFCEGCPYIPYCSGNCPGLAYTLTGHVNHPSPDACLRRFLEDGGHLVT